MSKTAGFALWKEIVIPAHKGSADMIAKIRAVGMEVDTWAEGLLLDHPCDARDTPLVRRLARVRNEEPGFTTSLVTIEETKAAGRRTGLQFLTAEDILALRLAYIEQPSEWLRIAMETFVDEDESHLDIAIVNDGIRRDLRTTWAFPQNVYQLHHEWLWRLPETD